MVDINLSDHQLIYVQRKKMKISAKKVFTGRSYRHYDANTFKADLVPEDWEEFYATNVPNKLLEIMISKIRTVANVMCPTKKFNIKNI